MFNACIHKDYHYFLMIPKRQTRYGKIAKFGKINDYILSSYLTITFKIFQTDNFLIPVQVNQQINRRINLKSGQHNHNNI